MGGLNLEQLTAKSSIGEKFQHWEKVATALEEKRMPPEKMPQPSDADGVPPSHGFGRSWAIMLPGMPATRAR